MAVWCVIVHLTICSSVLISLTGLLHFCQQSSHNSIKLFGSNYIHDLMLCLAYDWQSFLKSFFTSSQQISQSYIISFTTKQKFTFLWCLDLRVTLDLQGYTVLLLFFCDLSQSLVINVLCNVKSGIYYRHTILRLTKQTGSKRLNFSDSKIVFIRP